MLLNEFELFRINLTPDNTLFFSDVLEQDNFFSNFEQKITLSDVSYNMSRSFRIEGNALDFILNSELNYGRYRITPSDRYVYFFVNNYTYVNDNVCIVDFTTDYTQTFLIHNLDKIQFCKIGNVTPKTSYFDKAVPYVNKFTPSAFKSERVTELATKVGEKYLCFITVNFGSGIFGNDVTLYETLTEYGFDKNVYCAIFPIFYNPSTKGFEEYDFKWYYSQLETDEFVCNINKGTFSNVIKTLAPYIVDSSVAIITTPFDSIMRVSLIGNDVYKIKTGRTNYQKMTIDGINIMSPVSIGKYGEKMTATIPYNDYFERKEQALYRNPYVYFRIGNDINSIELNQYDYYDDVAPVGDNFIIEYRPSLVFPYPVQLDFVIRGKRNNDKHKLFTLVTTENVPYSISKWDEYYSQHRFSIDDGLATQQMYQTAQLRNDMKANQEKTNAQAVIGAVQWGAERVTSGITAGGQALVGDVGGAIKTAGSIRMSGISTASKIAESYWLLDIENRRQYNNLMNEQEKERALLAMGWNDIKSSPDIYSNTTTTLTSRYCKGWQGIAIDYYYATNIEDIKRYHKMYGFRLDKYDKFDTTKFIKQHTNFDFVSLSNVTFKSFLPHNIIASMCDVLNNGVRFWYSYDNFMNFDVDNSERVGV